MKLTPKQKAFAEYYIQLGNATEAAELLGKRYRLFTDKIENDTNGTVNSTTKLDFILK